MRFFVSRFTNSIKEALDGAGAGSRNFVQISEPNVAVFTGGGSSNPRLRSVLKEPLELAVGRAYLDVIDPVPAWVDNYGADVRATFPQLAVATGGCAPNLPDEKNSVIDTSVAGERSLAPTYR